MSTPQSFVLSVCIVALGVLPCAVECHGQELTSEPAQAESRKPLLREYTVEDWAGVRVSIERGLSYLKRQQRAGGIGESYTVATTSLAGLAVLGAGYHPGQAPYGTMLEGCLRYLRSVASVSGYITEAGKNQSRMHGHCYAVLFLTQLLGTAQNEAQDLAPLVKAGVQVIARSQSREGGWWYGETNAKQEDEASVTVCALQALRAARNVGVSVDSLVVTNARNYVRKCQVPDGSFCYRLTTRSRTSFALSVAALSTLNAAGVYESSELRKGMAYVYKTLALSPRSPWKVVEEEYPYYGNLYAAQTLYQDRSSQFDRWYAAVRQYLVNEQQPSGAWKSRYGDAYGTAVALLILEVPFGYLPIFQR